MTRDDNDLVHELAMCDPVDDGRLEQAWSESDVKDALIEEITSTSKDESGMNPTSGRGPGARRLGTLLAAATLVVTGGLVAIAQGEPEPATLVPRQATFDTCQQNDDQACRQALLDHVQRTGGAFERQAVADGVVSQDEYAQAAANVESCDAARGLTTRARRHEAPATQTWTYEFTSEMPADTSVDEVREIHEQCMSKHFHAIHRLWQQQHDR